MPNRHGFTKVELIIAISGIVLIAALLLFGVLDTQRRARDAERVSVLRQIEFNLTEYRNLHASYPDSLESMYQGAGIPGYGYAALPNGCRSDSPTLCTSYVISFALEGRIGTLSGGDCESSPEGITCVKR